MNATFMETSPDSEYSQKKQSEPERGHYRAAYEALIRQQEGHLLRIAERFCPGQRDYAEDLVQETLIRGFEAFLDGRFEEGTNARAWLVKILTNRYLSDLRQTRRHFSQTPLEALMQDGNCHPSLQNQDSDRPEAVLLRETLDEPLENALTALSTDLRLCVILADIEELSYIEIGQLLQIPVGTVRSRLFRARQQLHERLYDYAKKRRRV